MLKLCMGSVGRYTEAEGVCVCLWAGTHRQREFVSVFAQELETCVKAVHGVSRMSCMGRGR